MLLLVPEQALAVMEQRQGNTDEARRLLEEAVNTDPQHVQSWQVRRPPSTLLYTCMQASGPCLSGHVHNVHRCMAATPACIPSL